MRDTFLDGPADLVIEVISDDSVTRDRVEKFDEYLEAGVREYWVIDPRPGQQRALFYVLRTGCSCRSGRTPTARTARLWWQGCGWTWRGCGKKSQTWFASSRR